MNGKQEKKDGLDMFIRKPTGKTILFGIFFAPLLAVLLFSFVSPKYVWILFGPDPRYQPAGWIIVGGVILYWSGWYFLSRRRERIIVEFLESPKGKDGCPAGCGGLSW